MKSLQAKLLLHYIPLISLVAIALLVIQEIHYYTQHHKGLIEKLHQTADVQQQALALGLWEFDQEATQRLVRETGRLPFIQGVQVLDSSGQEIARSGSTIPPQDLRLYVIRPIIYRDRYTEERVGRLIISAHDRLLRETIFHNIKAHALIVGVMILALILANWYVTRRVILTPLEELRRSIQEMDQLNHWRPVVWESGDQIGKVIKAYNTLQENQIRMERQLKEQAEAIEKERNRFQLAIDGTKDGLWDWDMQTNRVFHSQRLSAMLGYQAGEIAEEPEFWSEMVHPDDREAAWQVMHDYFATRGAGTYENTLRLRTKQGQWRWITSRGKALFDRDGNPTRFVGFNTDIEHRKKTEDSLRKLSRAVEQSHGTILITDLEPRIEFVNPAFTRITGYQPSEVIGRNPSLLKSGHHDEAFYQDMWQTLCAGEEWSGEILNRAKDGTLFWEYCIISPVRDEEGKITHYVAIKENISSRKEAEQQLIDAKKAAEAANLAKSAFLANMSHELRTPLNAISGFAQLLLNAPQLPEEQRDHVRRIVRGGDYLLTLINDILDLSKIEVGRIELHPENLDLANFFRDVAEMIQLRAEQKGLTFEYQGDASLPGRVQADPKRLRQVLLNLLGNATKFTDSGFVRLTAQYQSDQLVLVIEDSGPGISPQDMPRIFDPFVQTGEDQYKSQGTGLGLSITHRIVKLMEGTIKADSKLGQGTRFEVRLPLEKSYQSLQRNHKEAASGGLNAEQISGYRRIPAAEQDQPDPSEGEPEPLRLMVVDDIPSNRVMLTYFLQPLGFEVVEADDGETCLKMAPEFEPDLVFMDMRMPGLNGLQTMAKLRAMPMFRELPVVIVSASVFHQDQATAIDQGATAYLHKPVDLTSLLTTLKQYLPIEWVLAKPEAEQTPQQQATPSRYPPQWLAELQQALSMGNGKRLRTLLEERKKSGEFVPAILFAWVDGYDHHQIQEWLAQQRDSGGKEER